MTNQLETELNTYLKELHLPTVRSMYPDFVKQAERESLGYRHFLFELIEQECQTRRNNKITRLLRESRLPLEKNLETFDLTRLPKKVIQQVRSLLDGGFLDRRENILVFGNPGSGKTHLLCSIAQEAILQGRRIYFSTSALLVQKLLLAKRDLQLEKQIKKLSRYDAILIDDIGYVQQNREEMEVLFTLLAERYERGSVMLSSNLPFSKWEQIFKDPMTTAAAIDRLVHHSVILELNIKSYRVEKAQGRKKGEEKPDRSSE